MGVTTTSEVTKDLAYYLNLPYCFMVHQSENGDGPYWAGRVRELPTISGVGATAAEAIESVRTSLELWVEDALESGAPIPEPATETQFSGKFVLRTTRTLHGDLAERAESEGVSLNTWCLTVLAQHGT
jgi:antitoxin HicB